MSIQSEIDRLAAAKAGLAAAIGTKGVVVPDGATLSEYPALVEQIQGGGDPWYEDPPEDGKSRLYIETLNPGQDITLSVYKDSGTFTVDWGDGSGPETLEGMIPYRYPHTYAAQGRYIIEISGEGYQLGDDMGMSNVIGRQMDRASRCLKRLYAAAPMISNACSSMFCLDMARCSADVMNYAFVQCYGLIQAILGEGVTTVYEAAFSGCSSLSVVRLLASVPPVLSNKSAFSSAPEDCIFYVPKGSLEAYQTATNWSAYADQMQEEPS